MQIIRRYLDRHAVSLCVHLLGLNSDRMGLSRVHTSASQA